MVTKVITWEDVVPGKVPVKAGRRFDSFERELELEMRTDLRSFFAADIPDLAERLQSACKRRDRRLVEYYVKLLYEETRTFFDDYDARVQEHGDLVAEAGGCMDLPDGPQDLML